MSTPCSATALVTFDIGGTLLTLRPDQPRAWAAKLAEHGLAIDVDRLEQSFAEERPVAADRRAESVGDNHRVTVEAGEWRRRAFVEQVLRRAGVPPARLEQATGLIREALNSPEMYVLYPDTVPTLSELWSRGLKLGVVSNTWPTMPRILVALGLDAYLGFWVISELFGLEKPRPEIFERALEIAGVEPGRAVHVGDDLTADALGAQRVGINPVLLDRRDAAAPHDGIPVIRRLDALLDLLP